MMYSLLTYPMRKIYSFDATKLEGVENVRLVHDFMTLSFTNMFRSIAENLMFETKNVSPADTGFSYLMLIPSQLWPRIIYEYGSFPTAYSLSKLIKHYKLGEVTINCCSQGFDMFMSFSVGWCVKKTLDELISTDLSWRISSIGMWFKNGVVDLPQKGSEVNVESNRG
eukprot:GHVR01159935.1.p1 GENE.GHVR01159935.1~~GHVR01159935.1.p1  ORF type:complete len:168 (-),score=18.16 GHVR01159935.1:1015-1518(-)